MNPNQTVAFQGEAGAFSSEAARKLLGDAIELLPCESFAQMFAAVENGACRYCLAPIENSLYGAVHQNYDLLLQHDQLRVVGEVNLRIIHNLIAAPGTKLEALEKIYSHPVALGQCQRFFATHPKMKAVAAYDTAGSVKLIMQSRETGAAAIASAAAAEVYDAEILLRGIEDDRQNFTRFLLLTRAEEAGDPPATADKTSIVFTLKNETGALFRAMAVFALRDIDLSKIESRPLGGHPWEYSFYVDFTGNLAEARVQHALAHLAEFAHHIKVLGCYQHAALPEC